MGNGKRKRKTKRKRSGKRKRQRKRNVKKWMEYGARFPGLNRSPNLFWSSKVTRFSGPTGFQFFLPAVRWQDFWPNWAPSSFGAIKLQDSLGQLGSQCSSDIYIYELML